MANEPIFPEAPTKPPAGQPLPEPLKSSRLIRLTLQPGESQPGEPRGEERILRLNKERLVLGSVISADVRLDGERVAPIHAVLEFANGQATLYDLASESGVQVNGERVVTHQLKEGDRISIGGNELVYALESMASANPKDLFNVAEGRKLFLNPGEDLKPLLTVDDERGVEEIFDFRPTRKPALEVIMSWLGTILEVEHFENEKAVTVGSARSSDFGIPAMLSGSRYAIVTRRGQEFVLNLDAQMKGVMHRGGRLQTLDDIRSHAAKGTHGHEIPIGKDDFAKITLGDVDFYLSFTAAPPRLKRRKMFERDPFFARVFFGSMVLTGAVVLAMVNAPIRQSIDAEKIPDRIATILYQPEKYVQKREKPPVPEVKKPVEAVKPPEPKPVPKPPEPRPTKTVKVEIKPNPTLKPKPVPKEMVVAPKPAPKPTAKVAPVATSKGSAHKESMAKEGEGARAKGNEGKRGSKTAAPGPVHQDKANRPSPTGGTGAGAGNSEVPDDGNVDILKGATGKIQNILGNSAAQLGKDGSKLKGFGGFTTQGTGGLALSGSGTGGGGTADTLTGGLGDKGTGGGRVGTGKGAAGNGTGIIGGQSRVSIRTGGPEEAVVMGSIDADAVERALMAHKDEFRNCYEREINAEHPGLAGRVSTSFVIGSSGRVTQAGIESTTLKSENTERCILKVIRSIDFPIPRGAGVVQVTYPFKFNPLK